MKLAYPITFPKGDTPDTYKDVTAGYTLYTLTCEGMEEGWVFRINGVEQDRDQFRNDLAERCGFKLEM